MPFSVGFLGKDFKVREGSRNVINRWSGRIALFPLSLFLAVVPQKTKNSMLNMILKPKLPPKCVSRLVLETLSCPKNPLNLISRQKRLQKLAKIAKVSFLESY